MSSVFLRVAVLGAPVHLGELFDYLPPKEFKHNASAGDRSAKHAEDGVQDLVGAATFEELYGHIIEVKFGNRNMRGVIIEVTHKTNFLGKLKRVEKVVSKYPVITHKLQKYYTELARYYGTRLANILEIAVPNWSKSGEKDYELHCAYQDKNLLPDAFKSHLKSPVPVAKLFANYTNYGTSKRFALYMAPIMVQDDDDSISHTLGWVQMMANLVANMHLNGKSVLLVVPTERDLDLLTLELAKFVDRAHFVSMSGSSTARNRYFNYLRILNGEVRVVLGTRLASLAPCESVDVCIVLHDLNGLHKDMRAPHIHSREVLLNRQSEELIIASYTRSPTVQRLVEVGYLQDVFPTREKLRELMPHIEVVQKILGARIPERASYAIRKALESGPVLILSPITGYVQLTACNNCAQIVRCDDCSSAVRVVQDEKYLICPKCSKVFNNWSCTNCHQNKLRFLRIGNDRLLEEVGKLFPGVVVRNSSSKASGRIIRDVDSAPQVIISTPGAEPIPAHGYAAVVILDANYWVDLTSLDGTEDTLSLWFYAISLVAPTRSGGVDGSFTGKVLVVGSIQSQLQDAVVRLDPRLVVSRELEMRKMNNLPPFVRCVVVIGQNCAIKQLVEQIDMETIGAQILGPFNLEETSYYKNLKDWSKKVSSDDENPLQCVILRVDVLNGRQMASSILSAYAKVYATPRARSGANARTSDMKILMDPKELL